MTLDLDFVRSQFDQLNDEPDFVFAANAGGSYVCNQVNAVLDDYNRHTRVQPYSRFRSSAAAGAAMDRAYEGWAEALNIDATELTIGPSTSMNTYVMAQAVGDGWGPGDEIVVTNQDHEANSGAWRRKAMVRGVTIRQWEVEPDSGLLNPEALIPLLRDTTRWVFFPHCSNIVGTINPVPEIIDAVRSRCDARVFIDAVAYAPHHVADIGALGVDGYAFSLYKVFGPHQGLMYVPRNLHESLKSQTHYFNRGNPRKDFNPAGPQHAQVAACAGVLDYFDTLHARHFGSGESGRSDRIAAIRRLVLGHENELAAALLEYLDHREDVWLLGKRHTRDDDRVPTISFTSRRHPSETVARRLQDAGIGAENGNFYAHRLIRDLGIDPDDGVVRLSLVHYTSADEVEQILAALETALE